MIDINRLNEYSNSGLNVTVDVIDQSDHLFTAIHGDKKIIGTYDTKRTPEEDEVVIIIGDFAVDKNSLCCNNPIKRHYRWALDFKYDYFEGDAVWHNLDAIYIINHVARKDRMFDILKEFKKANIPLNLVNIQPAVFGNFSPQPYVNSLFGCFKSHQFIFKNWINKSFNQIAIFEDDFTFCDPIQNTLTNLKTFFERTYKYDVTLLATSALGDIKQYDDLLSQSYQECTTTSGYFLSSDGLEKVYPLWQEALSKLLYTEDFNKFACDRYWSRIQKNGQMYTFNSKIGYQRPSVSQTSNMLVYNLD